MSEAYSVKGKLNHITRLCQSERKLFSVRPVPLIGGEKIVKVLNAGPCGASVIGAYIVPAEIGCVIHNSASRIKALGYKISAVSAYLVENVIFGISWKRPFSGVGNSFFTVIHVTLPPYLFNEIYGKIIIIIRKACTPCIECLADSVRFFHIVLNPLIFAA